MLNKQDEHIRFNRKNNPWVSHKIWQQFLKLLQDCLFKWYLHLYTLPICMLWYFLFPSFCFALSFIFMLTVDEVVPILWLKLCFSTWIFWISETQVFYVGGLINSKVKNIKMRSICSICSVFFQYLWTPLRFYLFPGFITTDLKDCVTNRLLEGSARSRWTGSGVLKQRNPLNM